MFIYVFVFISTTLLGVMFDNQTNNLHSQLSIKTQKSWLFIIILFIYVIFVGCRGYNVGADTQMYVDRLAEASSSHYYDFIMSKGFIEPFFYSFVWIFSKVTHSAWLFFLTSSFFYFFILLKFSTRFSNSFGWSIWLFNSLGFTTLAISNVRQSLAIALCLIAYMSMNKGWWKPWLYVILASCTHLSAVVFIPMLFVSELRKRNIILLLISLLALVSIFGSDLMGNLALSYALSTGKDIYESADEEGVGGIGMIAFLSLVLVMGTLSYFPKKSKYPDTYYNEYIAVALALIVFIISRFNQGTMRLFWYYLIFASVYIPNVFSIKDKGKRQLWQIVVFAITFYYLSYRIMASPYEETRMLLPYSFVWE